MTKIGETLFRLTDISPTNSLPQPSPNQSHPKLLFLLCDIPRPPPEHHLDKSYIPYIHLVLPNTGFGNSFQVLNFISSKTD